VSYNVSCSLSKQTIAPGHHCFVLPLVQQKAFTPTAISHRGEPFGHHFGDTTTNCYTGARWSPSHTMIDAVYRDRGQFELVQDHSNLVSTMRYMQEVYKEQLSAEYAGGRIDFHSYVATELPDLAEAFQDARSLHHLEVLEADLIGPVNKAWEYLNHALVNRWMFSLQRGTPAQARLTAFHHAAVHGAIEISETRIDLHDNELARRATFERAIARAIEECKEDLDSEPQAVQGGIQVLLARLGSPAAATMPLLLEGLRSDYASIVMTFQSGMCDELLKLGDGTNESKRISLNSRSAIRALFFGEITIDQCYAGMLPDLNALCLAGGMQSMNMKFEPANYAGSDVGNEAGQRYAAFMSYMSGEMSALYREVGLDNVPARPSPK
jgi:hypothetical protein